MHKSNYIYHFNYNDNESDLCKLESRHIFSTEEQNKMLFSDKKVEPSSSAFIKKRIDVMLSSDHYPTLISDIKRLDIHAEGFKVEYLVLHGDTTKYNDRLKKLKDIGYSIEGDPDYYNPTITYALCFNKGIWYFGIMNKDNFDWHKHKQKPCSYSNSINVSIAKALINIAAEADKDKKLIDACCGVGTVMLEACFSGNNIEGCDINEKIYKQAKENLSHFNYTANVYHSDIKDINKRYDAAIIDLPYNLFCYADDDIILHIMKSTAEITDRLVIVSTSDITELLSSAGLAVSDYCNIKKGRKANLSRRIWVCEKN